MQLSIPELPSCSEVTAATTITSEHGDGNGGQTAEEQVSSALDMAEEAAKAARKEWEALSKLDAVTARCFSCEEWWRASAKNIVRACIACSIGIATTRKGLQQAKGCAVSEILTVEMPDAGKRYHDFWVVPKVSIQKT